MGQWIAGGYCLERVVGEGGLGIVFLARDAALDRKVAVKVLRPDMAERPELCSALIEQARRLADVKHPHIVTVHACGTHRGYPYVVMELVDGNNALDRLRDAGGRLDVDEVLRILGALSEGLAALHAQGIVHGDVKPSNVLLEHGNRVKLTDGGLSSIPTGRSALQGTAAYLAPECILGDEPGPASDVYSFGVTAFQLLTGALPFAGKTNAVSEHSAAARTFRPELPGAIEPVLAGMLAKNPRARPASALVAMTGIRDAMLARVSESNIRQEAVRPKGGALRRLLVADDDPDLLQGLATAVATTLRGCAVEGVSTGEDALTSARHRLPDAVVLDLQMPGRSTPEITRALRDLPGGDRIPIVVITGTGSASDWREVKAAGADGCLLKPFDIRELIANLERYAAQRRSV